MKPSLRNPAMALALLACIMVSGVASAQDAADFEIEDIVYYFAAGSHTSGHLTVGQDPSGQNQTAFNGCAHMILRDKPEENDVGRMQVIGRLGHQYFNFDFNSFQGHLPDMDGGLAQDIFVDGSRLHPGAIQHPAVFAGMAGWGTGGLYMDTLPFPDPVTGSQELQASMFVTPNGFRDNETGAIYNKEGGIWSPGDVGKIGHNDWEIHLRIESPPEIRQPDAVFNYQRPGDAVGYFTPSEAYSERFVFDNVRFGGTATIKVVAEALAGAGENSLTFTFRDQTGLVLDEHTLAPSVLGDDSYTAEVPLTSFGNYSLVVAGEVRLSKYDFTLTQHTPDVFDLGLWWDNVTFARASTQTLWDCQDAVGAPEELADVVVARIEPPPFDWVPIGFGMAAVVVGVVLTGKLVHMSWIQFRRH